MASIRENPRALEAFEYYYLMGADRSLRGVAAKYGVSEVTVGKWSKKYDWVHRCKMRDLKNMKLVAEADDKAYVESMRNYKKLVSASVAKYVKELQANKVVVNSVKDFEKLVRLDLELSDRIINNDECKLAQGNAETGGSSLELILNRLRGEVEEAVNDSSDKTNDNFGSVDDLTDNSEDDA